MRNFTVIHVPQRSPAWFEARLGRLTGSRAKDMLATIKNGEAAARIELRVQLACERLTGQSEESGFVNADMQRGIDLEDAAFAAYEAQTGSVVERVGFLEHQTLQVGCSLDGYVGDFEGIIELKCPRSKTHLRYIRSGGACPPEHLAQVWHNLWVSGADWCDVVSFDPRFPASLQMWICRMASDAQAIADYAQKAEAFLREVETEVAAVRTLENPAAVLREAVLR